MRAAHNFQYRVRLRERLCGRGVGGRGRAAGGKERTHNSRYAAHPVREAAIKPEPPACQWRVARF